MSSRHSPSPLRLTLICFALVAASFGLVASAQPDLDDPRFDEPRLDLDPQVDFAVRCLADTRVERFVASPAEVQPFEQTTLSWRVSVPPGCGVGLSLAGRRVAAVDSIVVTPIHLESRFELVASMLGTRSVVGSVPVTVARAGCSGVPLPMTRVGDEIRAAVDAFIADDDDLEPTGEETTIESRSTGLFVDAFIKVHFLVFLSSDVRLEMGLGFAVREGRIGVHYLLFRPRADTALPDDLVESKFFDRSESIRAAFEHGFNEQLDSLLGGDLELFDLIFSDRGIEAVLCEDERPPRLTVRLNVVPPADPGRFNLRVDDRTLRADARHGDSTGARLVGSGDHRVGQSAGSGTDLSDYLSRIGGDCAPDGRVSLEPGDVKTCSITNERRRDPARCRADCRADQDACFDLPGSTPRLCIALFDDCVSRCG